VINFDQRLYDNGMHFVPMSAGRGARILALEFRQQLELHEHVLWLVSGGSNIPLTVQVMDELPLEFTSKMTVMPIDERYGPPGHKDSNVKQLYDAGFKPKLATVFSPLDGSSVAATLKRYNNAVKQAFNEGDFVVAQVGMGADGHVAGIFPNSSILDSPDLVAAYDAPDFTRLTLTPNGIRQVDLAYLFAYGREKRAALDRLCDGDFPLNDQPAQVLRELKEVTIFNDQLDERNA
jgi:6-phosphogluconolactonase/glucosamine-6-phosphate isomerase/deaminase